MRSTAVRQVPRESKLYSSIFFTLILFLSTFATMQAQVGSASLSGVVQDPTGAIVSNAKVTLQNTASGAVRSSQSNSSGAFTFSAVSSGDYKLTVQETGFKQLVQSAIHLNPGDSLALPNLRLAIGEATDTVTVDAGGATLPLDDSQLSATITSNDLERLSVIGRDATELEKTLPGFAIHNTSSSNEATDFSQVQVGTPTPYASNGSPIAGITLKLDGANLTDPGNFGASLQSINNSFVSEVQVQTSNFGADEANGPVVIQAVTKAGTAKYHGSLYAYARTYQLNANDWLANFNDEARPQDRYLYPGGTFSGPVPGIKKLTFFVGAEYDAQRNIYAYDDVNQAIIHALVPTAAMRMGDFSAASISTYLGPLAGNGTYANLAASPTFGINGTPISNGNIAPWLDPGAKALINAMLPLPTYATDTAGYNWTGQNLVNNNVSDITGRLDYAINSHSSIFGRYTFEKEKQGQPQQLGYSPNLSFPTMGDTNTPGGGLNNVTHVNSAAANYVNTLSATMTNELYATLTWSVQAYDAVTPSALSSAGIGYPYQGVYDNGSKDFPQYQDYGADGLPVVLPPDITFGAPGVTKVIPAVGDNLTKVLGKHTLKGGVFLQKITDNSMDPTQVDGATSANGAILDYFYPGAGTKFGSYEGNFPNSDVPEFGPVIYTESGNSLANYMEGIIQDFTQQNYVPRTNLNFWTLDGFVQDAWRVKPNLVLTYGVRIDHMGPWLDAHNIGAFVWEPSLYASDAAAGTTTTPGFRYHGTDSSIPNSGMPAPPTYFEPRAGFSWDVFKNGKTTLRGGAGIYRMHDSAADVSTAFANAEGLRTGTVFGNGSATLSGVSLLQEPQSYGGSDAAAFGLSATDNKEPVTNNYSLSLSQQLPNNSIFQLSYVGNNSNSLMNNGTGNEAVTLNNIDAVPVGYLYLPSTAALLQPGVTPTNGDTVAPTHFCNPTGCTPLQVATLNAEDIQAVRPYGAYTELTVPLHNTYANYNALQAMYIKQTGRLTYNINYTFAKSLGIIGSAADLNWTAGVNPFSIASNYGPMNFDRSQIFNASYSYKFGKLVQSRLLGGFANGWMISGITNLESGPNMQTGVSPSPDFAFTGTVGLPGNTMPVNAQTILGTPDVSLQPTITCNLKSNLGPHQYLNGNCFGVPAIGTNGPYIMPYVHGPAFFNSDLSAEKSVGLERGRSLKLRVAAFNFLNHGLTSFTSSFANQMTLNLSNNTAGGTYANATNSNAVFGTAGQKIGHRTLEVSGVFSF
ncbi:MAG TPA: carboxypeptidase-like regulatory domain-containing protein [Terracidiphilus sp.]